MIEDVKLLLQTHGIKYRQKGNSIFCLCPNPQHNDKHIGSFSFDIAKGQGHCFSCGIGVNIFSLNRLLGEKMEYNKNINYEFTKSLKPKKEKIVYYKPVIFGKLYNPKTNNQVMDFLHSIGFSDDFIDRKEIKYCRYCEMIAENLVNDDEEEPTKMRNRICIPIYKDGKLVNYECRSFDGEEPKVKYVNGCKINLIYNYENIDLTKEVILSEGIKNIGKCYIINKNVISSFGNQITDIKLEMLNKIPKLLVFLDNDDGGLLMAKKLKECYNGELKATFCPKFHKNGKGYDMNDCTIEEIEYYLNHTMSIDKAIKILENIDSKDTIFWT